MWCGRKYCHERSLKLSTRTCTAIAGELRDGGGVLPSKEEHGDVECLELLLNLV